MVNLLDGFFADSHVAEGAIHALANIAPGDPFWDDVEPFVERIRSLAAEKLASRELKQREDELMLALGHLRENGAAALAFHEAADVLEWSPADFDAPAWPAVTTACAELHDRLAQHSALQRAQPTNRTAERERRARFEALEEDILERLGVLRGLLVAPEPPVMPATTTEIAEDSAVTAGDELHAPLDAEGDHYSVFTLGEEQRLTAPRPGVCLVFASTATGLDSVGASMSGIARRRAALIEVPRSVQPSDLGAWMKENRAGDHERVIAWQRLGRWSTELGPGLRHLVQAQEIGGFRLLLVGGPAEARAFLSMEARDQVAARLDLVVPCARWQLSAIEQRIRDARLDAGNGAAADVMSATRGWHRLLDVLWTRKAASPRLDSMIGGFTSTFRSPGGHSGFYAALGLSVFPEAEAVFALMARGSYSPRPAAAIPRWIMDRGADFSEDVVSRAIAFLTMFQLLEVDSEGNLSIDPIAREVLKAEF